MAEYSVELHTVCDLLSYLIQQYCLTFFQRDTSVDFVLPILWPQPDMITRVRTRPDFAAAPTGWDVAVVLAEIDSNAHQKDRRRMIMTGIVHAMVLRFITGKPVVVSALWIGKKMDVELILLCATQENGFKVSCCVEPVHNLNDRVL